MAHRLDQPVHVRRSAPRERRHDVQQVLANGHGVADGLKDSRRRAEMLTGRMSAGGQRGRGGQHRGGRVGHRPDDRDAAQRPFQRRKGNSRDHGDDELLPTDTPVIWPRTSRVSLGFTARTTMLAASSSGGLTGVIWTPYGACSPASRSRLLRFVAQMASGGRTWRLSNPLMRASAMLPAPIIPMTI